MVSTGCCSSLSSLVQVSCGSLSSLVQVVVVAFTLADGSQG